MSRFAPAISIASLGRHPGKSMRFEGNVGALHFDEFAMFGDREIMFVEFGQHEHTKWQKGTVSGPGRLITQREDPILTQIVPDLDLARRRLSLRLDNASGQETSSIAMASDDSKNHRKISVWGWDGIGIDLGDEFAEFGEMAIGRPVRLVSVSRSHPRFVEGNERLGRVGFADTTPLLITSVGSIDEVNRKLVERGKAPIPLDRWRANLILESDEPWIEDRIAQIVFTGANGGEIVLTRLKACGRCPIPDTDQLTGATGHDVRGALGKLGRNGVHSNSQKYGNDKNLFFGQGFVIAKGSEPDILSVDGAPGVAHLSTHSNWVAI